MRLVLALVPLVALLLSTQPAAADVVVLEDWKRLPVGSRGVPVDWKGQTWGKPAYDFTVVDNDGHRVLRLRSRNEGSTISKDIKGRVKLRETPILEWSWKVVTLPAGGDSRRKDRDDQGGQIYVAWPRFPEAVRSRIIGYVWDTTAPAGTIVRSEKTGTVTYIILRSGTAELGKWFTERRNVREDYRKIFGEEPDDPGAISLAIDTNDTNSEAEAFVGPILFRSP